MATSATISKCLSLLETIPGGAMTDAAREAYAAAVLEPLPDDVARQLVWQAIRTCKRRPSVSELLEMLRASDGRPTPDEAWAMCPRSEAETVVWTDEMAEAHGIAWPLIRAGDLVAARVAFLRAYERLVQQARDAGRPPRWTVSMGYDPAHREAVIAMAVEQGRISPEQARALLPPSEELDARIARVVNATAQALRLPGARDAHE